MPAARSTLTASAAATKTKPAPPSCPQRTVLLHRLYRLARHALVVDIPLRLLLLNQRPRLADLRQAAAMERTSASGVAWAASTNAGGARESRLSTARGLMEATGRSKPLQHTHLQQPSAPPTFILRFSLLRPPKILSTRITISCKHDEARGEVWSIPHTWHLHGVPRAQHQRNQR